MTLLRAVGLVLAIIGAASGWASAGHIPRLKAATPDLRTRGGYSPSVAVMHVFGSWPNGSDGANPEGTLIVGTGGAPYGTTQNGGSGYGVIFKFTPTGVPGHVTYPETVLYTFTGGADGAHPIAGLVADSSGALYGTTPSGGSTGEGVVFKLTPRRPGSRVGRNLCCIHSARCLDRSTGPRRKPAYSGRAARCTAPPRMVGAPV
jgi:uncharacterized repeat protein (TIGR03803 family)